MECPHCSKEIPGTPCPHCQSLNPDHANYCMMCGAHVNKEPPVAEEGGSAYDLEERILCPDGTCTGIIENGRCTECGTVSGEKGNQGGQ
jgi:hypothetical protein